MDLITKKPDLKKHLGTVQISNPLSLVQRKAFSVLLYNAYHDLKESEGKIHSIPMKAFCELLGYNSKDFASLDAQIEKLQKTTISWVKNPEEFHRVTFFSYTGMKDGEYRYSFHPELEKKLYHPEIYAQINIAALSQFESRYALALYENLARYRPNKKSGFMGGSPQWELEKFRELMGVTSLYSDFRDLKKRVIVPAVREINEVSDLLVDYDVSRKGRKVTGLKFMVKDNPQQSLALIPEPQTVEKEAENPLAIQMKELFGVPPLQAGEWLLQFGEDRVKEVFEMVVEAVEGGNLKNPIGYMRKAFSEGWVSGKSVKDAQEELKAQKRKLKQEAAVNKRKEQELKAKEAKEEKERKEKAVPNYLKELNEVKKIHLYEEFYDSSHGSWIGGGFPLKRGEDPNESGDELVKMWFFNHIAENRLRD